MTNSNPDMALPQKPEDRISEAIRDGLAKKGMTKETLVDRLRVSPDTIECLMNGSELRFMPEIYVHGYMRQIAEERELDTEQMYGLYESAYTDQTEDLDANEMAVMPFRTVAVTASLACVGILAVIVAFLGG